VTGWDHPATAARYEAFASKHDRYREANRHLLDEAEISEASRVLDVGAGTGRTAEAILERWPRAEVACFEPARAMRTCAERRLRGRVRLLDHLEGSWDVVVCAAALWQWTPIEEAIATLAERLVPGGALVFDIPSAYLGEPDAPGDGADPSLTELLVRLAARWGGRTCTPWEPLGRTRIEAALARRFTFRSWSWRRKLRQVELADWLAIPVLTDALAPDVDPDERARIIGEEARGLDPSSYRWEGWSGWTARLR